LLLGLQGWGGCFFLLGSFWAPIPPPGCIQGTVLRGGSFFNFLLCFCFISYYSLIFSFFSFLLLPLLFFPFESIFFFPFFFCFVFNPPANCFLSCSVLAWPGQPPPCGRGRPCHEPFHSATYVLCRFCFARPCFLLFCGHVTIEFPPTLRPPSSFPHPPPPPVPSAILPCLQLVWVPPKHPPATLANFWCFAPPAFWINPPTFHPNVFILQSSFPAPLLFFIPLKTPSTV